MTTFEKKELRPTRDPDDGERLAIVAAEHQLAAMPARLDAGTRIHDQNGTTHIVQGALHSDNEGWRAQFKAAFGTTSELVVKVELERMAKALRQKDGKIDPAELDAVIAIVSGQRPKSELEAMVVCQMAITHALAMRAAGKLNRSDQIVLQDSNARTFARLTKAFAGQVDALAKLRRGSEQRVVVEHVHIYPVAQAIVGTVTHAGAPGALLENRKQPHATEQSESVRSEDAERQAVPVAPRERPTTVPNARRRTRVRSAKRKT